MTVRLFRFMSYFGAKHENAARYPKPQYDTIVEPFAGSAGYACLHWSRDVILYDINPDIADVWRYLISVDPDEIRALPDYIDGEIDQLGIPRPAELLIGWWIRYGVANPTKRGTPSYKIRRWNNQDRASIWNSVVRDTIASQVKLIRHWRIVQGSYADIPDLKATWYIDPPYQRSGKHYPCRNIDYDHLRKWTLARKGQVIACGQEGDDWLPFRHFRDFRAQQSSKSKKSIETIWYRSDRKTGFVY